MELKEIRQIVELMNEHELSLFHLEKKDFTIKLKKGVDLDGLRDLLGARMAAPHHLHGEPVVSGTTSSTVPGEPVDNGNAISSPMVGTFYRRPAPDAEEFVRVGDAVTEGQTLCIIEAMKVMNEIKAESAGVITEVCIEDSTPVQYGDILFRIK